MPDSLAHAVRSCGAQYYAWHLRSALRSALGITTATAKSVVCVPNARLLAHAVVIRGAEACLNQKSIDQLVVWTDPTYSQESWYQLVRVLHLLVSTIY